MHELVSTGCSECLSLNSEDGIAKGLERDKDALGFAEDLSFIAVGWFERKVDKPKENCLKVEGVPRWGLTQADKSFLIDGSL